MPVPFNPPKAPALLYWTAPVVPPGLVPPPPEMVQVPPKVQEVELMVIEELTRAELGMAEAATESVGVVVLVATEGTSQVGHEPVFATKLVTEPPPVPEPVKVQVVPEHEPAPEEKLKVNAPPVELILETPPEAPQSESQALEPVL
jgi:hypothetical protein